METHPISTSRYSHSSPEKRVDCEMCSREIPNKLTSDAPQGAQEKKIQS